MCGFVQILQNYGADLTLACADMYGFYSENLGSNPAVKCTCSIFLLCISFLYIKNQNLAEYRILLIEHKYRTPLIFIFVYFSFLSLFGLGKD